MRYKLLTAHIKPKTFGRTYQVCDLLYYTYVSKVILTFDKLQPNIFIDKMKNYGINSNILNMLSSFLERRKQCVKVNGTFSSYIDVCVGASQGTKLGPLVWLFYD